MLKRALNKGSNLRESVRAGLDAVAKADRDLIKEQERQRVGDSLDLDEATRVGKDSEHRWDYILCVPDRHRLVGLEPHSPAKDFEIDVVMKKKRNAQEVLRDHVPSSHAIKLWIWVTRGKVGFLKLEKARWRLQEAGIRFDGRMVKSFDD